MLMSLKKALWVLGIGKILEDKKKEASELARRGLFEGCNEVNEAIRVIRQYMHE